MIRNAVVAGQFYSGSREALFKEVKSFVDTKAKKEDAIGVVCPHAGFMYSGPVAGSVFSSIKTKPVYIIIGPNHTGLGGPFGLDVSGSWATPLGEVPIDTELSRKIMNNCKYIKRESLSHSSEHSIEVQLPFLQYVQKDFKFVPITVSHASLGVYRDIGEGIAKSVKESKLENDVMIIASSDMTHYESQAAAEKKDRLAIEAMLALDEERLMKVISEHDISMCGYASATIMIWAVKNLGAKSARLVKYQTSGDITGDYSSVVGYAGIIIT